MYFLRRILLPGPLLLIIRFLAFMLGRASANLAAPLWSPESCAVNVAGLPILIDRGKIAAFCRAPGLRRLSLFGPVLRPDSDPTRSDVPVLLAAVEPMLRDSGDSSAR